LEQAQRHDRLEPLAAILLNYAYNASEREEMPTGVRYAIGAAVTLLVGGAVYLMIVRGPVVLLDLANSVATFLCL
jgi:hypothetical protein